MASLDSDKGKKLQRFKPGVAPQVHLFCAAILWSGVGIILLVRGIILLKCGECLWLIGAGMLLGLIKSRVILDRTARHGVERISRFAGTVCIGAVYSWQTWLLVLAMMGFGFILRRLGVSPMLLGVVCLAIGTALVYSSRFAWLALMGRKQGA